jgi:hypothetical protein
VPDHKLHAAGLVADLLSSVCQMTALQDLQLEIISGLKDWPESAGCELTALSQLTNLSLGEDGVEYYAERIWLNVCSWLEPWLACQTCLQHLRLFAWTCEPSDDSEKGWLSLAPQILHNTGLTELDLSRNTLSVLFAAAMRSGLEAMPHLRKLHTASMTDLDGLFEYNNDIHGDDDEDEATKGWRYPFMLHNSVKTGDAVQIQYNPDKRPRVGFLLKFTDALGPKLLSLDENLQNELKACSGMPVDNVCAAAAL